MEGRVSEPEVRVTETETEKETEEALVVQAIQESWKALHPCTVVQKLEETAAQTVEIRTMIPAETDPRTRLVEEEAKGAINAADALLHASCVLPMHAAPKSIEVTEVVSSAVCSCEHRRLGPEAATEVEWAVSVLVDLCTKRHS